MNVIALMIGGCLGTILRYTIGEFMSPFSNGFPFETLAINLIGCFILGWFFTLATDRLRIRPELRLGLGTGFIGAFTTFSTFTVQSAVLLQQGHIFTSVLYIVSSIFGGLLLTFMGVRAAKIRRRNGNV